jgi:Carboxypeptidase regulatory-like domain
MHRLPVLPLVIWACIGTRGVLADYREVPVADGGTISGAVLAAGEVPVLPLQPVFKRLEICGDAVADERLVVGTGGVLANAVVDVVDVPAGKAVPRDRPVVLDNIKCAFVPHVRSATVGQILEIHNGDPFLHDAHAWLGTRSLFNVGILPGHTAHQPLADAGLVHINCNVRHTWMHAYVFVADDPYHAVSDRDGRFVIDQVPPGTYTLRVWHELLGSVDRTVTVEAGKTVTVDFALPVVAPVPPAQAP